MRTAESRWTAGLVLLAVALRLALLGASPRLGYLYDHDDLVRFGLMAADRGVLSLYDHPAPQVAARVFGDDGRPRLVRRAYGRSFNYPPLLGVLLFVSGTVLSRLDPDPIVNTAASRILFGLWNVLADLLLAWGGARLVARFSLEEAASFRVRAALLLAPPLVWGSAVWGQLDAPLLAGSVWMLLALVERRFLRAGVLLGLLLGFKPQALFFAPTWLVACAQAPRRAFRALAVAGATLGLATLPFTLHGGLTWLKASYLDNASRVAEGTTLHAFNLWYADLLLAGSPDATAHVLGLSKVAWGLLLFALETGLGLLAIGHRWGSDPRALLPAAALSLLLAVMLPTGIHERFVEVALPFLLVAGIVWRPLAPAALLLTAVAFAQLTWNLWFHPPGTLPFEWGCVLAALVGAVLTVRRILALGPPPEETAG